MQNYSTNIFQIGEELNELQRYSVSGKIDAGILVNLSEEKVNELIQLFKEKELGKVRKWIVNNLDNDPVRIFRVLYDTLYDRIDSSTVPHLVLVLVLITLIRVQVVADKR